MVAARQGLAEKAQPVSAKDLVHLRIAIPLLNHNFCDLVEVGDSLEADRGLLSSESSVKIAANRDVIGATGDRANVVDVRDH